MNQVRASNSNTSNTIEIIENQLYWISDRNPPKNEENAFFFCIDHDLVYQPFFADFGPLDLGKTYRFITELEKLLKNENCLKYRIYHYTSFDTSKRANAAYLIGAFQVVVLGRSADEVWLPFSKIQPPLADFRDASFGPCTYKCSILDCLRGLEYAIKLKWFDLRTFNLREYEFYEKVDNGDLNWIIPGKFIAFSGPASNPNDPEGWRTFTPEDYVPLFKKFGVSLVVRLNKKQYEASRFTKNGIKHLELYFLDGSCPSDVIHIIINLNNNLRRSVTRYILDPRESSLNIDQSFELILKQTLLFNQEIVNIFLEAVEKEKGAIAVHCKAGLGRTGTLIGCYAIKHYRFPAADFIGWIRICRPGSVLGPQQQFLIDKQNKLFKLSENSPIWKGLSSALQDKIENGYQVKYSVSVDKKKIQEIPEKNKEEKGAMSPQDKLIAHYGDYGQANRLLNQKRLQNSPRPDFTNSYSPQLPSNNNTSSTSSMMTTSQLSNGTARAMGSSTRSSKGKADAPSRLMQPDSERSMMVSTNERNKSQNSPNLRYITEDNNKNRDKSFEIPSSSSPNSSKRLQKKKVADQGTPIRLNSKSFAIGSPTLRKQLN